MDFVYLFFVVGCWCFSDRLTLAPTYYIILYSWLVANTSFVRKRGIQLILFVYFLLAQGKSHQTCDGKKIALLLHLFSVTKSFKKQNLQRKITKTNLKKRNLNEIKPPIFIVGKCWFPLNFPDIVGFRLIFFKFAGFCWISIEKIIGNCWKKKSNVGKYWFKFAYVGFCWISFEIWKKKVHNVGICWNIWIFVGICWNLTQKFCLVYKGRHFISNVQVLVLAFAFFFFCPILPVFRSSTYASPL